MTKARDTSNLVSSVTGIAVTISGDPVVLGVGNTEHVRVTGSGLVGIGTDNPQEDLHIGSNSPYILLDDYDNNYKWKLKGTAWFAIEDTTAGEDRLRITSNGNIGIATDNPLANLQVTDGAGGASLLLGARNSNAKYQYINFNGTTNGDHGWQIGRSPASGIGPDNGLYVYNILTSSTEIGITTTGNVGINTSSNINGKLTLQADDDSEILFQVRSHTGRSAQLKSTASASSSAPFVFHTNNSWGFDVDDGAPGGRVLTLASDYNVGIGTAATSPSCKLEIVDTATHTAYASATPSITDCTLALANHPASEAINNHATIQFNVYGGTYNRVCSISAVAESASNRYGALTFCTDDANTRSEKMRISADGRVMIGGQTTGVKTYIYDDSGANASLYSYHNGTGAYAGLFRAQGGDSTQYACYGYVNTSSSYSSGGILGYSINSNKYAILGYWSTAAYYGIYSNGLIYSSGGFSSSDERLKDVSSRIEGGVLDELTSLVPVEYTWKDNTEQGRGLEGVTQIGLIAQEVEVNFPHLVMENFHTRITGINSTSLNEEIGMCKSVEYGKLTCYLLVALTEAYDKIKALEQHVGIAST